MKKTFIITAFLFFMLAVSIFSVIAINMSENSSLITLDEYTGSATKSLSQTSASENATISTASPQAEITSSVTETSYSFPMDINNADINALTQAEGIGSKLAQDIIDYRTSVGVIADMNSLMEINGIGEAKLNSLKKLFYAPHDGENTSASATTVPTVVTDSRTSPDTTIRTTIKSTSLTTTTVVTETPILTTVPTKTSLTDPPVRRTVSINLADASELEEALLITREQAEEIVQLRERIGGYSNILEILYCESISDGLYIEIRGYLTL